MEEKEKLKNRINDIKNDKQIIQEWMVEENNRLREEDILNTAREDAYEEGEKSGIEQGIKQGIEKGIEQGIATKTVQVIKNMLKKRIDYSTISDVTGKKIYEIKKIEEEL